MALSNVNTSHCHGYYKIYEGYVGLLIVVMTPMLRK
jgi:hypothetical protein